MVAGYRMAVTGWSSPDALAEAKHSGFFVPAQIGFVQSFGAQLDAQQQARERGEPLPHPEFGPFPIRKLGSVAPDAAQGSAGIDSAE